MKIAVFIKRTTLHAGFGGLETQNQFLCEGLVKKGHEVYVFSPKYELSNDEATENGVHYIFTKAIYKTRAGFAALEKNNWLNKAPEVFRAYNSKLKFDVILGQSSAALSILNAQPRINVPVVSISHGTIIGEYLTRLQNIQGFRDLIRFGIDTIYVLYNFFGRQREFVTHSKKVIAVSKFVKESLLNETYANEENIQVIYNGVDPEKFSKKIESVVSNSSAGNPVKIVYVGQIYKSKGLLDLLFALKKLTSISDINKITLDIFGDGNYISELKSQISKLNLTQFVNLRGKVPYTQILTSLSNYDIFIIPSRRKEGFPMTIVEAMFSELPVIGANIGGIPEAIENEVSGLLYESGNVEELARCIEKLVTNPILRTQMGKTAKKLAHERFTLDIMLDKYEKILKEVKK